MLTDELSFFSEHPNLERLKHYDYVTAFFTSDIKHKTFPNSLI